MATVTYRSTTLNGRLCRGFSIALLAVVAFYALAPTSVQASPKGKGTTRRPPTPKPPVFRPSRIATDAARDAGLANEAADEAANARAAKKWEKRRDDLGGGLPHRDYKTKKYWFRGTDHTFYSEDSAREAWAVTVDVYDCLSRGDVKGAKKIWQKAKKGAETLWHGKQWRTPRREIRYGEGKDAKARGDADESAQNDIIDGLWHDIKGAEASGLKPVKARAPAKN